MPQLFKTAIFELEADRIGHAIGLVYSPELMSEVVRRKIGVEGCPGSNVTTGMLQNVGLLGIRELLKAGVLYPIHPDDDLFMPDLSEVFHMCNDVYRFTEEEKTLLIRNAWLTRFGNRKEHKF